MFEEFGEIESAKVIMDRFTGRSKGFGFVEMPGNSEAEQAVKALNGKFIEGRNIKVNQANPGGKSPNLISAINLQFSVIESSGTISTIVPGNLID